MSLSDLPRGYDNWKLRGPDERKPELDPEDDDGLTGLDPEDDDGLTGPCPECHGKGIVYSDPDGRQLVCGECEGREES